MPNRSELLETVGAYFHAYNRGVDKRPIFLGRQDYMVFLNLIRESLLGLGLVVLNFCLMPNHFHFTLRQDEQYAMSEFFWRLCKPYALYFNAVNSRAGHLFQGRYRPKPIRDPGTVVNVSRYIHLNPVTAGLVKFPEDWEWSSCQDYFGRQRFDFVDSSLICSSVGSFERYRAIVMGTTSADLEEIRRTLNRREHEQAVGKRGLIVSQRRSSDQGGKANQAK